MLMPCHFSCYSKLFKLTKPGPEDILRVTRGNKTLYYDLAPGLSTFLGSHYYDSHPDRLGRTWPSRVLGVAAQADTTVLVYSRRSAVSSQEFDHRLSSHSRVHSVLSPISTYFRFGEPLED
jgi:hypothetical protein